MRPIVENLGKRTAILPGGPGRFQQLRHLTIGLHKLLDDEGLPDLPSPIDKQCAVFSFGEKGIQFSLYFSADHGIVLL